MASPKARQRAEKPEGAEAALRQATKRLAECRSLRKGVIAIRASGPGGGDFCFECAPGNAKLMKAMPFESPPIIEIIGDARRIQAVLAGQKDARANFLAGGFRVRGDLRYFSDLAVELGILKEPL